VHTLSKFRKSKPQENRLAHTLPTIRLKWDDCHGDHEFVNGCNHGSVSVSDGSPIFHFQLIHFHLDCRLPFVVRLLSSTITQSQITKSVIP
jgi:hypothetical protein